VGWDDTLELTHTNTTIVNNKEPQKGNFNQYLSKFSKNQPVAPNMTISIQWSSIYLQLSSFNFLMSGLFGDILCLRFFLSWAYIWLFVNAMSAFPSLGEFLHKPGETFLLHYDVLFWSTVTLYTHLSKFIGIALNEKKVPLPEEAQPLWRMLYRNSGLSELLFQQYLYPQKFQLITITTGTQLSSSDNCLYIILDGTADAQITLQKGDTFCDLETSDTSISHHHNTTTAATTSSTTTTTATTATATTSRRSLALASGDVINVKALQLFRKGSQSEAFASQSVTATALTDMRLYRIKDVDIVSMAQKPQTKQAYQGLLIYVLTSIAEREIMNRHFAGSNEYSDDSSHREAKGNDGRDSAFQPLEEWEYPQPVISGSGMALTIPFQHFMMALKQSYRPPWPMSQWEPGLRHSALPAPHLLLSSLTTIPSSSTPTRKDTMNTISNHAEDANSATNPTHDHHPNTIINNDNTVPFYGSTTIIDERE
jgi:hypothetical protein